MSTLYDYRTFCPNCPGGKIGIFDRKCDSCSFSSPELQSRSSYKHYSPPELRSRSSSGSNTPTESLSKQYRAVSPTLVGASERLGGYSPPRTRTPEHSYRRSSVSELSQISAELFTSRYSPPPIAYSPPLGGGALDYKTRTNKAEWTDEDEDTYGDRHPNYYINYDKLLSANSQPTPQRQQINQFVDAVPQRQQNNFYSQPTPQRQQHNRYSQPTPQRQQNTQHVGRAQRGYAPAPQEPVYVVQPQPRRRNRFGSNFEATGW